MVDNARLWLEEVFDRSLRIHFLRSNAAIYATKTSGLDTIEDHA
jgi:hypothetical protein